MLIVSYKTSSGSHYMYEGREQNTKIIYV